jgi:glutaminyl-tRNA synthetase
MTTPAAATPKPSTPSAPAEPLQGRPLAEGWDVNPPHLLARHLEETRGVLRTRFPPEPNGYLHAGHAKSMFMNFSEAFERISAARGGPVQRHVTFRYDDTNPEAESQEFIDSIARSVKWMGWSPDRVTYTSDYFDQLYEFAERLIESGRAYVCHQTGDEIENSRRIARALHAGLDVQGQVPERCV